MIRYKVLNIITGGISNDGITTSWLSFCKELSKKNYHDLIQMDFLAIEDISASEIILIIQNLGYKTPTISSRNRNTFKYMFNLYKILKKGHYNIIHVNGSSSIMLIELFIGWLAGVKVRIAHSRNTLCKYNNIHNVLKMPFNLFCNGRFACGVDAGKWLFGKRKFDVIHNGKDLKKFQFSLKTRNEVREKYSLHNNLVIGHVGKFNDQKNHSFLIEIFEKLLQSVPNSMLMLVGDGPLFNRINDIVNSKGLSEKVVFTGAVDNVANYLQGMDIMVLPSKYEGLPNVVLEWQAAGLPSIISDTITKECAVSDLVSFESINNGTDSWIKEIIRLKENVKDREKESEKGIDLLKKNGFEIEDAANILEESYSKLILG